MLVDMALSAVLLTKLGLIPTCSSTVVAWVRPQHLLDYLPNHFDQTLLTKGIHCWLRIIYVQNAID